MPRNFRAQTKRLTVSKNSTGAIIDAIESIELDIDEVVAAAGVVSPSQLLEEDARGMLSRLTFARFAREAMLAIQNHVCRRDALRPLPLSSFRLMCIAMLACPTLLLSIDTAREFLSVVEQRRKLEVRREGGLAFVVLDIGTRGRDLVDLMLVMFGLSAFHRLFGWLIQHEMPIKHVMLDFAPIDTPVFFSELFQMSPSFNHSCNCIAFSASYLDHPIVQSYVELDNLLAAFPFDLLPPDYESQTLAERTKTVTSAALARSESLPDITQLADIFGLSIATFRRRIAAEGTSVIAIRNECRTALAARLLSETTLTIKDIAFRTQYGNVAAFRRAFANWTGHSPRAFRQRAYPG